MQFYYDSSGKLIKSIPEEVYQGSANANTIYFIGAFPENCVVAIAYIYPNGVVSEQKLLARVTDLSEIQTESGQTFNVWKCTIDAVVTEHYGTATIQFFVYDGRDTATQKEKAIATQACNFDILKGVPYIIPDDFATGSDLLTQILSVLPTVGEISEYRDEAVNSAQSASESATQAEQSATSALNSSNTALQSETNAKNSEGIAVASATQAQESALIAQESAQSATKSAEIAQEVSVKNTKDIKNIYTLLGATVTDEYPLSQAYSTRQTADGNADIIDGALTRVTKIQGATVVGTDGTLKNAYFKGIRSTGKNLYNGEQNITVRKGYSFYIFNGYITGKVYFKCKFDGTSEALGTQLISIIQANDTETIILANEMNDIKVISNGVKSIRISNWSRTNGTLTDIMLSYNKDDAYEPYKADESFMLDEAVPLGAWDYIDIQEENGIISATIIKQTATATSETAFTEEQLAEYTDYVLSADGLTVAYKSQSIIDEQALAIPTDKYQAWTGGSETQVQGDTDNSADGANCEITQIYYTQKGA